MISLAESYLAAYARLDLAALERLYAENAVFNDPTSADVPGIGGPFVWRGRREILARCGEIGAKVKANRRLARWLEKLAGVFLIGFGLKLGSS